MSFTEIDVTTPAGTEKKKFGDDRIREFKEQTRDNLGVMSNYPASTMPALRTAVWTTATRPTGDELVDRVTGYNETLGYEEYYDLGTTTWIANNKTATDHVVQATGAHAATAISNTAAGNITATTVQAAINELDTEKAKLAGDTAQTFQVANATAATMALALGQLSGVISATGYVIIPIWNGTAKVDVYVQWGTVSAGESSATFATAFPNACLSIQFTPIGTGKIFDNWYYEISDPTTTGFTKNQTNYGGKYLAIGW